MHSPPPGPPTPHDGAPARFDAGAAERLAHFVVRVQKALSHDLGTPLGTIVNYASVLEGMQEANADEVRDLGRRIRANAQRSARMVQLITIALGHAGRARRASATDLVALASAVLADAGGRGAVHGSPASAPPVVALDAEVLGFAWRAYVALESDARGCAVDELELGCALAEGRAVVDLTCRPVPGTGGDARAPASTTRQEYVRHSGGPARLECALGLGLAEELVVCHGGELQVWGRPGASSLLRVVLPGAAG